MPQRSPHHHPLPLHQAEHAQLLLGHRLADTDLGLDVLTPATAAALGHGLWPWHGANALAHLLCWRFGCWRSFDDGESAFIGHALMLRRNARLLKGPCVAFSQLIQVQITALVVVEAVKGQPAFPEQLAACRAKHLVLALCALGF